MIPRDYQDSIADDALELLREHAIAYLAMEERTGKSLTGLLVMERAQVGHVLIVTKKKALDDWHDLLRRFNHSKTYEVINYHQLKNCKSIRHDAVILDEAHNYISAAPNKSAIWKEARRLCKGRPILYMSATPKPQGAYMLYHQFALSDWSPWAKYSSYRSWWQMYGIPDSVWVQSVERQIYTKTREDEVMACCEHLFISYTRKQLGFEHEPEDKLHYLTLSEKTREMYNTLVNDRVLPIGDQTIVADSAIRLRTSLHMLEGGVFKIDDFYGNIPGETTKIDFIKKTWGDTEDVAIMYNYIAEGNKLRAAFKRAVILQATSFAEGIDLTHVRHLVIYSQDFSTGRFTQRRARQASGHRDEPIHVNFLLVEKAVSEQVYQTVSINKENFVDSVFEKVTI